jgi:hypothetical protein
MNCSRDGGEPAGVLDTAEPLSQDSVPRPGHAIEAQIEVSQRCALSCKTPCPAITDLIVAEIEVNQHWAMRQHSCKPLYIFSFDIAGMMFNGVVTHDSIVDATNQAQIEYGDAACGCQHLKLPENEL